jgi:hypothetical protein
MALNKTNNREGGSEEPEDILSFGKHRSLDKALEVTETMQRTAVYYPVSLHKRFKRACVDEGRSMNNIINELVAKWMEEKGY